MSDAALITHTLQVRGLDGESIRAAMIAALEADGFVVVPPTEPWETPSALAHRLGMLPHSLSRCLHNPDRPRAKAERRGPTGRLLAVISTPEMDGWLKSRLRPGATVAARTATTHQEEVPA